MKLNFWQILGVVLMILALIVILYREFGGEKKNDPKPGDAPTTLPAAA